MRREMGDEREELLLVMSYAAHTLRWMDRPAAHK